MVVSESRNSRLKQLDTAAISTHDSARIVGARATKENQKMEHAKVQVADSESKTAPGSTHPEQPRVGQQCRYACWTSPGFAFTPSDGYPPDPMALGCGRVHMEKTRRRTKKTKNKKSDAQRPVRTISWLSIRDQSNMADVFQGGCRVGAIGLTSRFRAFLARSVDTLVNVCLSHGFVVTF